MSKFRARTLQQHQLALGQCFPNDRLFAAKNIKGKNLYKLLMGLSGELQRVDAILQSVWDGTNILTTQDTNYIALWEGFVGIPDNCFTKTTSLTIEERRSQVLIKLRSLGVLTAQDFIDLAELLGVTAEIDSGINIGTFPVTFPIPLFANKKAARFTMIVYLPSSLAPTSIFTFTFPFILSSEGGSVVECLFNKLKPAMTSIIYNYTL